jgi:hypothetical protein
MLQPPFDIITCSWPRPVEQRDRCWTSEPEWDAPLMPKHPELYWEQVHDEWCWMINWRSFFKDGLKRWDHHSGGEMRGFHIVFRIRVNGSGTLVFWDDDGSIIRRNGEVIHTDRAVHPPTRNEVAVSAGDELEIAQWQYHYEWLWAARLCPANEHEHTFLTAQHALQPYLEPVLQRLNRPGGPPLKIYTDARTPVRTVVAIYSLILNGYVPSAVHLFGDYQWSDQARHLFAAALPFARIVTLPQVVTHIHSIGGPGLVELARRYWYVMKTCVALLCPPEEYCLMDDDIFILDHMHDALAAFSSHDLVYMPDQDMGESYIAAWGKTYNHAGRLRTSKLNTGLYWLRSRHDPRRIAAQILQSRFPPNQPWIWEQGLVALAYARHETFELPGQRYFYPIFDGLPGGMLGYDYARNPCGFASIHFGGLAEKPSDGITLTLAPQILERQPTCSDPPCREQEADAGITL